MIYCPQCGTSNKPSSKFCKNCSALLQPSTDVRCPICGTMNPQNAEACKSCNTRLNTSAAGSSTSNQATPADAPENIAPYNPPEMSQEPDTPADKKQPASTRAAFAQSNSQWLRRIAKTPPSEPKPPEPPPAASAADAPAPVETPASQDWLKQPDTAAAQTAAIAAASTEPPASTETASKPQLSEIKLTGDDYDYSDIGGEVTDEMKAQLDAEAGNVQSVEDEVALAMRLLGLGAASEAIAQTAKPQVVEPAPPIPAPVEPVAQMQTAAPESVAESETIAPVVPEPVAAVETPFPAEPIAAVETPFPAEPIAAAVVASEMLASTEPPASTETASKPQLSEIKLTGDDYDYSDIGGEVTDEMKAQLDAEAGNVQSVEDEVALAMRLLGLGVAGTAVASAVSPSETLAPVQAAPPTEPIAQEPLTPQVEATEAIASAPLEPIADTETALPVIPVEAVTQEPAETIAAVAPEEPENAEWLTRLAAASSAAVAAKMVGEARAESAEPETKTMPTAERTAESPVAETPAEVLPPQEVIVAAAAADTSHMPAWLREIAPPEVVQSDTATEQGNIPEWVQDLAPGAVVVGTTAFLSHLPDLDESERGDLPDWLREPIAPPEVEAKTEFAAEAEQAAPEELVSHAPVELPSWMRGGGTAGYDPYEMVETTGPLAGVSGILPLAVALTEPHTLSTATPPRTDSGRIFQTLLAEPLAAAAPAQPETRAARMFTSKHLLYLLIFLAAVLALFLPSGADELGLLGKDVVASPGAVFYDQLNALPAQSTVLMAFDYVPGQGPELDPAARAILEILAARQVNVITLSSNPNGAVMAQSLLEQAKQAHPDLTFANLGFIPGNEAGLKTLALGWLPSTYTDASGVPWNQSPLSKTVRGMDDLVLSILILGEPNGLNGWMTQVQPIVKSPMIAATTAAIEPQARIYVNSKQLNASLRGLTGAAELELWSGNSGRAVKTVNALSFVSLVLAGIIIATNLVWLMKRKKR